MVVTMVTLLGLGSLAMLQMAAGATPTNAPLPADKAARASAAQSFLAAAARSGKENGLVAVVRPQPGDVKLGTDIGIKAGDGELSPDGASVAPIGYSGSMQATNAWFTGTPTAAHLTVWAGASRTDSQQGVLVESIYDASDNPTSWLTVEVPGREGSVRITSANGKILTLTSANGTTHTFDCETGILN